MKEPHIGQMVHYYADAADNATYLGAYRLSYDHPYPAMVVEAGEDGPHLQVFTPSHTRPQFIVHQVVMGTEPGQWQPIPDQQWVITGPPAKLIAGELGEVYEILWDKDQQIEALERLRDGSYSTIAAIHAAVDPGTESDLDTLTQVVALRAERDQLKEALSRLAGTGRQPQDDPREKAP